MLPDGVLLEIFDFYVDQEKIEAWQTLAHVGHRWRTVVFESPRRLNLRLVCTPGTPARNTLGVWPALPLFIEYSTVYPIENVDNIVAALERRNRVRQISLRVVSISDLEDVLAAAQKPFPELTYLGLLLDHDEAVAVLPDSFLGGSAPHLRTLSFRRISFPSLPKLLLSATHLVDLYLYDIPHSGYFSPDAMVTALSALTNLAILELDFQSPRSCPDRASHRPPPLTRLILPVLTHFWFKGVGEYLDDLVACTNAPRLLLFHIIFFNQIVFDSPQLIQFISRTPILEDLENARVTFKHGAAVVNLSSKTVASDCGDLEIKIPCEKLDWQVSSVEQVCTSCLPPLSMLEVLCIFGSPSWKSENQDNIENTLWLELLQPFGTVKELYLSKEFAPRIAPALQELVEGGTTEVLPALQNIFLEVLIPTQEGIEQFVTMRQASYPITVSRCKKIS